MYTKEESISRMNHLGAQGEAFFFLIPYDEGLSLISCKNKPAPGLSFSLPLGYHCAPEHASRPLPDKPFFRSFPTSREHYGKSFQQVMDHLYRGDSYLLNLCFPTRVETNLELAHFFHKAQAPFKLLLEGKEFCLSQDKEEFAFVCFSPEEFIRIRGNQISTFPMKGTADASSPDSAEQLLSDEKEKREHATIVDLMRNDLSMIATNIEVKRYRYLDLVPTSGGGVWQCSSEITGTLPTDWRSRLGTLLRTILPAGSITGAPKESTCCAIQKAEMQNRGYFTGIFGYFNGSDLDSAVAIRFLEKNNSQLHYKSGGGLTTMSSLQEEYEELIRKVYVPFVF